MKPPSHCLYSCFRAAACVILFAAGWGTVTATASAEKPNLILIMADDFGYECVGADGGESYETPHLDRLAASGVRFEHCHSYPHCTPTRVAINRDVKHFAGMTAYMDKMVGRLDAKLDELGIRGNTLLMFLGDNGTHSSVTSRLDGVSYPGGKGSTTARGTRVPFIASWPAEIEKWRVCQDLVGAADFLPTLCEAAGISMPPGTDGISFLPQLRGKSGTPRESLYIWYSPRRQSDLSVKEYAFDLRHKLYRDGRLSDLVADPFEESEPLRPDAAPASRAKLQSVLDLYGKARPEALDRVFLLENQNATSRPDQGKKKSESQSPHPLE